MLQTCEALSPPVLPKIAPIPSSFWLLSSTLPAGSTEIHSLKANLKLLSMWTLSLISQSVNVGRGARGNTSQNITKQQTELDPKEGRQTEAQTLLFHQGELSGTPIMWEKLKVPMTSADYI